MPPRLLGHALGMDIGPRALIDGGLELTVVGSFSRIGHAVRRRLYDWSDPRPDALAGKTVLVTGPTSGLGRAAAEAVAALGARVVLVGRTRSRLTELRSTLIAAHSVDRFPIVVADMASLASVADAVERVATTEGRLDVLIDNAGAIFPDRRETGDGIEATFATMVVGPFALVSGLLHLLRRTGGSRVIAVTSGGMYAQRLDLDDLQSRIGTYSGTRAYARAKRAQVALVREWARRLGPPNTSGVAINAMHPGWADTPGLAEALPGFARVMRPVLRSPAEGIDTLLWLATAGEGADWSGRLFLDRRPRPFDRAPITRLARADRRRLWDTVVAAARVRDPAPE